MLRQASDPKLKASGGTAVADEAPIVSAEGAAIPAATQPVCMLIEHVTSDAAHHRQKSPCVVCDSTPQCHCHASTSRVN
jgi:hypothetical protein